jgi:trehalose 6-phosphate phosphatase
MPRPPELDIDDALFIDFDGTLVDIALNPADVVVPRSLLALLAGLEAGLDGALAIISGRPIKDLDKHLAPLQLAAAGEHGAELRHVSKGKIEQSVLLPAGASDHLQALHKELGGTVLEVKTASAALHYREAPEHESAAIAGVLNLVAQHADYEFMPGKMVAEFKPGNINKGIAIAQLAAQEPFAGRRPVFIGDDVTDEAGFAVINELGGLSIRVGTEAPTEAQYGMDGVEDVQRWLARLC